jgi:hypothetical protein
MSNIEFKIEKKIVVIKKYSKWSKELNLVSWGNNPPKYDIRNWDQEHEKMKKGVTFTLEELETLKDILNNLDFKQLKNSNEPRNEVKTETTLSSGNDVKIPGVLTDILF